MIISSSSTQPSQYLGQGIDLGENHIDFLVSQGLPSSQKSTLVQGSFVIALKTQVYQHTIGYPNPESLDHDLIYLLRVRKSKGVPEASSPLHGMAQEIICHNIATHGPVDDRGAGAGRVAAGSPQTPSIQFLRTHLRSLVGHA